MAAVMPAQNIAAWRAIFAGLCASLVGVGMARFAYTPLIPALIAAHWFAPAAAVYLGAANFAGYLGGALLARGRRGARSGGAATLRAMMVAGDGGVLRLCGTVVLRLVFRVALRGRALRRSLMALAAPAVLPQVPAARRGLAGGVIFTGVGLGIAGLGNAGAVAMRAGLGGGVARSRRRRRWR